MALDVSHHGNDTAGESADAPQYTENNAYDCGGRQFST